MTPARNQRVLLASRPEGLPRPENFGIVEEPCPIPADGQLLLEILYLSLDPYMRGRMDDAKSYAEPVALGAVMEGGTVARVIASRHAQYAVGDIVLSHSGWQRYALSDGLGLRKLDPSAAAPSTALGVLGMPGFTAWAGLLQIGRPRPGETVVVAAASGAVGSAVGQIARIQGAHLSASRAVPTNAPSCATSWASTPWSTTARPISRSSWQAPARKASMCISRTSAARCGMRYSRC